MRHLSRGEHNPKAKKKPRPRTQNARFATSIHTATVLEQVHDTLLDLCTYLHIIALQTVVFIAQATIYCVFIDTLPKLIEVQKAARYSVFVYTRLALWLLSYHTMAQHNEHRDVDVDVDMYMMDDSIIGGGTSNNNARSGGMNRNNINVNVNLSNSNIVRPVPHHHRRSISLPFPSVTGMTMVDGNWGTRNRSRNSATLQAQPQIHARPSSACSGSLSYSGAHSGFSSIHHRHNHPHPQSNFIPSKQSESGHSAVPADTHATTAANQKSITNPNTNMSTSGSFILNRNPQSDDDEHELAFLHRRSTNRDRRRRERDQDRNRFRNTGVRDRMNSNMNMPSNGWDRREYERDRDREPLSLSPFEPLTKDRNYNWPGQRGGKISPLPRDEYEAWSKRRERNIELKQKQQQQQWGGISSSHNPNTFRPVPVSPLESLHPSHPGSAAKNPNAADSESEPEPKHEPFSPSRRDLMEENDRLKDRIVQLEHMLALSQTNGDGNENAAATDVEKHTNMGFASPSSLDDEGMTGATARNANINAVHSESNDHGMGMDSDQGCDFSDATGALSMFGNRTFPRNDAHSMDVKRPEAQVPIGSSRNHESTQSTSQCMVGKEPPRIMTLDRSQRFKAQTSQDQPWRTTGLNSLPFGNNVHVTASVAVEPNSNSNYPVEIPIAHMETNNAVAGYNSSLPPSHDTYAKNNGIRRGKDNAGDCCATLFTSHSKRKRPRMDLDASSV